MTTVEFRNIDKYFPGVKALDHISFSAESGKVYAFLGENGAGKSTLLKIMNGDYIADNGQILINSKECNFENPKDALKHGISVIYQERQILKEMTVAENVFLGDWIRKPNGFIDYETMNKKTAEISKKFGLDIEPDERVSKLSIAYQQMIEIMKAINRDSEIIAFDEPTAALSDKEITILFSIIEQLKKEGKVIFYVSHRMNEISEIADEVIVFKDGCLVGCKKQSETNEDELIRMMVGRPLGQIFDELDRNEEIGDVCLEFKNVTTDYVNNISFSARKGEVLGFAGLVGAGRTEIMNAVFGIDKVNQGQIFLNGKPIDVKNPEQAINYGIALVPEDRKDQGILPNISVQGNISISILKSLINKIGSINEKKELKIANEKIKQLNIKTPDANKIISQLSGGNQQKVILARWLETNPQVLILDEPTKGIDVGAKAEFYNIIQECAKMGMAVIVISSELQEVIGLSHRIIVIKEGKVSGELLREDATEESVLKLAMASEKKDDK